MKQQDYALCRETFLWALGSACQIHRLPFDPQLVLQQYPPPYSLADLQRATQALGFKVSLKACSPEQASQHELPCIGILKDVSDMDHDATVDQQSNPDDSHPEKTLTTSLGLIVKTDGDRLLYFKVGDKAPTTTSLKEAEHRFEPVILLFVPNEKTLPDDSAGVEPVKFGFKWFIPELLKYKGIWRDVLLASLAIQLMALATPLFTQVIIDKVIVHHTMNTLVVVGFGLLMFMLFSSVMTWIRQYLVLHTGNRIDAVLGSKVFSHLFELPIRYFERRPTGTLIARVQGVETIREFISGAAVTLILDFPFLFIFLGIMFFYSWELTLIVVGILVAISIISLAITPTLRKRLNEQFQLGARNQAFLTEYVSGMETVKSLQMEPQLKQTYGDYLASYLNASFKMRRLSNTYNVSATTLEQMQTLAVLCLGAWLVMTTNSFTIGMLVAFQMFASRLSQPALRMVGLWQQFQQANIAVKRLGDIMDAPTEPYTISPARAPGSNGRIEIKDLSFRYSNELPYLYRDLNLTIRQGNAVAILGPSGSGKSTLTKLMQGFYRPSDGQILIDGRDICHLCVNELRHYFGVVPQETTLFSGTIYDNLIAANPHATFEQVIQACRMAEIHDTIEQLPQGYQNEIGEHGTGLSGGQKQRMAIARALLKRPKILVFDEATSNLDQATAEHFAQTINQLKGKVTILFITHKMPKSLKVDDAVILGTRSADGKQDDPVNMNNDQGMHTSKSKGVGS